MTDPTLSDDELVSAVLDGAATEDERRRVEASPVLQARLEQFRRIREGLGAGSVTGFQGDVSQITRALDAWAAQEGSDAPGAPADLGAHADRKRRARAVWLSAAAALLLIAGIGGVLSRSDSGGRSQTASAPDESSFGAESADRQQSESDGTKDALPDPPASPPSTDGPETGQESGMDLQAAAAGPTLGAFDLRSSLDALVLGLSRSSGFVPDPGTPCQEELRQGSADPVGTALLLGKAVVVGVGPAGLVVVLDLGTCQPGP